MPSEPIFDLASIDLDQTMADRTGVARRIPHRGDVLQIDRIIWHDDAFDHGVAIKHVREDEFWVPGHIPGNPLLPGVLMLEAGAQLASWLYYSRCAERWFAGFTRIENSRFRGHVVPGNDLMLLCKCLKFTPKRFVCDIQGLVDGNIVFDSTITGMAFPKLGTVDIRPLDEVAPRALQR
jgi:3-hydroxyacyl-[acyl-carrier-protein] dehydratase